MIDENARSIIPVYAQTEIPHREDEVETMINRIMNRAAERIRVGFRRKWGILIIGAALFTIYTVLLSASVAHRTEIRVRQEMAGEAAAAVEQYKAEQDKKEKDAEEEQKKAGFLTGEASQQNYINMLAGTLSEHVASLRMERGVTAAGAETYAWVDLARFASGLYGSTLEEVLSDPKQIEGYIKGHATRPEDDEIGLRVATNYVMKKFPTGYNMNMMFARIMADGSVEARDQYDTGPDTRYFAIGK
jgi:hypothetical protein